MIKKKILICNFMCTDHFLNVTIVLDNTVNIKVLRLKHY